MHRPLAALTVCVSLAFAAFADEPPPNVIVILADDLGYGDPGCYNPRSKIPTPALDRLAAEGMRFTDAHSPSAVCTPTRYGLLTGRYAWRTRLKSGVLGPYSAPLIEQGRPTLASVLREHGYATACVGKWHLGMQWATHEPGVRLPLLWDRQFDRSQIDLAGPITAGPLTAGFDHFFGNEAPNFPPYCFLVGDRIYGPIPATEKPDDVYGNPGRIQKGWSLHNVLPNLRDRAVRFVHDSAGSGPFFLYLPLTSPHRPIVPNAAWAGASRAGDYGDFVAETDGVVGAVLDALDAEGVADQTLVVFTSDNGSCGPAGDPHLRGPDWHENMAVSDRYGHHPNAPWRGMKADAFEGGHRVPLLVRWPARVAPGSVNDQLVGHVDLLRTVGHIVGHQLPSDAAEDSYDLLPTFADPTQPARPDLVHHSGGGKFALRRGEWKLIEGRGSGGWTRVETSDDDPPGQLYNLATDPKETTNLYLSRPEVVAELRGRLDEVRSAGRSEPAPST